MLRVAVSGATGRMGSRIIALMNEYEGLSLAAAIDRNDHPGIGKDVGSLISLGELGVRLSSSVEDLAGKADVLIEFSSVAATLEHLRIASKKGISMVIGTTGFSGDEMAEIKNLTRDIPCVFAPNMSVGVNLLLKVLRDVAVVLGEDYDIEIVEAHHRLKKDAPSGTALKMASVIAEAVGRNLEDVAVYARHGIIGERSKREIGIQAIRAGDIVGEHTVIFGGLGERIEITHKASSRDTFARGALRAAQWLSGKGPGLYDMQDVLGLK